MMPLGDWFVYKMDTTASRLMKIGNDVKKGMPEKMVMIKCCKKLMIHIGVFSSKVSPLKHV